VQCEQVWITARDGTRLAADLYLPPSSAPAPVVLEALPYRKDDLTGESHADDYLRLGTLLQGSLEQSNVEAVTEITNLIQAQRAYEMNSKVITAADQMLQSTAQLMR